MEMAFVKPFYEVLKQKMYISDINKNVYCIIKGRWAVIRTECT